MKSNQFFSFPRFVNVLKSDLLPKRKAITTWTMSAFGVMLVIALLSAYSNYAFGDLALQSVSQRFQGLFQLIAFIMGLVITAGAFKPLGDSRIAHGYLGVPASHFEKYLSKWLMTGPIYLIASMALIALAAVVVKLILAIYPGLSLDLGYTLKEIKWNAITGYLMPHAVFLLGAIAFKRQAFGKTLLATMTMFFAWAVFTGIAFWFFIGSSVTSESFGHETGASFNLSFPEDFIGIGSEYAWWIPAVISVLVWAALNAAGYFKLKETEV